MKERSLISLFQVPEARRAAMVAEGLQALAEHVEALVTDARTLWDARRHRSAKIIDLLATEQAGAALILFDLVRAGKLRNDRPAKLCKRFYDHRTRAIYAAAYTAALVDLNEAQDFADLYRDDLCLDGPNDVDWILRNELDHERESAMYVDLVDFGEGSPAPRWETPRQYLYTEGTSVPYRPSRAVTVLLALNVIGLTSTAGVEATKAAWSSIDIESRRAIDWSEARALNKTVIAAHAAASSSPIAYRREVVNHWLFPLTTVDFTKQRVKRADLVKLRDKTLEAEYEYWL
ncbi:AbiV family abortive infection protein [uncultured Gordonia sp.]|uniref:AbiV family abortive infection protein n=1 Tax=uncultured Gordonia sp. TaxID=198437 RepID=UPI002597EE91|nr:AbiV family abortive infection protein [uncultured Gordonia sp.]